VEKSVFTPHYQILRKAVARFRRAAGLTQRELAAKLRVPQNTVLRIEQGERRIDLVEFWRICRACGAPFERTVLEFARAWKKLDAGRKGQAPHPTV
jgi:transcriptional regulator with XRE-family HTH domain